MGQDEPLPVEVEHILRAQGRNGYAASPLAGFEEQVNLRIVPEGLEMADPDRRSEDRLLIKYALGAECDADAKALFDQAGQDFDLYVSHDLGPDFAGVFIPDEVQGRILLLQRTEPAEKCLRTDLLRQQHGPGHNRFEHRLCHSGFHTETVTGHDFRNSRDGTDATAFHAAGKFVFFTGVQAELVRFFIGPDGIFYVQAPAGDLDVSEPRTLRIPADLVDPGAECFRGSGPGELLKAGIGKRIFLKAVHEQADILHMEGRAEPDGEQLPPGDRLRYGRG